MSQTFEKIDRVLTLIVNVTDRAITMMAMLLISVDVIVFTVIGIWPAPLKMQPGSAPINEHVVRDFSLTAALLLLGLLKLLSRIARRKLPGKGREQRESD